MAYATKTELSALAGMDDASITDATKDDALAYAEDLIDRYCGTSFTYKAFSKTLDGNDCRDINVGVLFPQTLTSVTVDSVAQTTTGWGLHPEGVIIRDTGVFDSNIVGRNVVVAGTAGETETAPPGIKLVCLHLARQYILDDVGRIPDRALSITNEFGTVQLAQAGGTPWRPTELPNANAILNRHRHRGPKAF